MPAHYHKGFSLIELMIALLIGAILLLGLVQVFGASRTAYQLSQGMARVQENARFATDYLQRDIRMAGHYGCVNDQARLLGNASGASALGMHFSAADNPLNFNISVQGYEASATAPGDTVDLAAPTGGWTPALPPYLSSLAPAPLAGSDILVLRYLDSDGVPVIGLAANQVTVDSTRWNVLTQDGVANPALFGVADCSFADIFQADAIDPAAGVVTTSASGGVKVSAPDFTSRYTASPAGQTMLYRAESLVYYIAANPAGNPALYRARFTTTLGGPVISVTEEMVEGIESLQFIYGQDQSADVAQLSGNVTDFGTAAGLGGAITNENAWRRVGQIKVGMVVASPESAAAAAPQNANAIRALGTIFTPPADGQYRSTYESAIALRNRLYGN